MKRILAVALLLMSGLALVSPGQANAAASKRCHGKVATQVLTEPGTLYFTDGDDVFYGSSGDDDFLLPFGAGFSGTDIVCGNGGDDVILGVSGRGSIADGGSGSDFVLASLGGKALGGSGQDYLVIAYGPGASADGGAGNDGEGFLLQDSGRFEGYLSQIAGLTDYMNGPGVWALFNASADGGSGDDLVSGNGAASLLGGSGRDLVYVGPEWVDKVDCGSDADWVWYDGGSSNSERRCENNGRPR